ncbi:class I SAM-dependent methyltransferase [Synechocystis sp. LEGE 06083]|uniref:class I SAM-dependent methyltransferase n=1 Tax=Synechocystis sp. LEGE 06083 TaxID=915336 RepID=UPI00187E3394|nr:class I SAM-dependent methyltransferase [Synechocystis sp. LEGE 06083]MBE9196448.1 class I SAM-dependent methyltransferase [Synechocystis sp. LEGE 06083]
MALLNPDQRSKLDPSNDGQFYAYPRFVTHVDNGFIEQLTELYRQKLKPGTKILDLMGSWVSHLPGEMNFAHVEGHGLNEEELAKNPRLDHYFVQNLNENPALGFPDGEFDAVLMAVSVQYLQYPEAVFSEIARILKPGGVVIVSFSNRMFYQKAIAAWRDGTDASHLQLVRAYIQSVKEFGPPEIIVKPGQNLPGFLQLLGMAGSDPFYAVVASVENGTVDNHG